MQVTTKLSIVLPGLLVVARATSSWSLEWFIDLALHPGAVLSGKE